VPTPSTDGDKNVLVVGADSLIGASIIGFLSERGWNVRGTTRRRENVSPRVQHLDLSDPKMDFDPTPFRNLVFCASVAGFERCAADPVGTGRINVDATINILKYFSERGTHSVFLSSTAVFDGTKPFYTETDLPAPQSVYGEQKLQVETQVKNDSVAVLRLTKVVYPDLPLLRKWRASLEKGEKISAFVDKTLSPLPLADVCAAIHYLVEEKKTGIHHLGGRREISYFDFAKECFPGEERNILPTKGTDESAPNHSSLRTSLCFESLRAR
jgi:dTDP-4-dehydrorhamnose reductase